jgi:hypothetical protein
LDDQHPLRTAVQTEQRVRFYDNHRAVFIILYVVAQVAIYAYAYFRRRGVNPTPLLPQFATAIAAVPLAALLTQWLFLHKSPHIVTWSASFVVILGIIVGMSGLASRSITASLQRVLAATIAVLVIDVVTGAQLQLGGFFGSSPALGARYYGLGNVASVLLLVASVLWCTMHVRAGSAIGPGAKRSAWWRALAIATMIVFVIGTPGLGSDVGGLFTSSVVFAALFAALWSNALDLKRAAAIAGGGVLLVIAVAIVDAQRAVGERTHLGRLAARIGNEGISPLLDTVGRKVHANLLGYGFPWTVFLVTGALAMIVGLLQGRWAGTLPKKSCERIGAIAALVGSAVAYGVNDSGIVTLVLVAVFLGPFLMVFHRQNRWNIPKLEVFSQ